MKCKCGEKRICSDQAYISGPGILRRTSAGLLACGLIKKQLEQARLLMKKVRGK